MRALSAPTLVILGGKDVLVDSAGTRRRLKACVQGVDIRYFPEGRHLVRGQASAILGFLRGAGAG